MLDEEAVKKLVEAGRVAAKARDYGASLVQEGESARRICERVEQYIVNSGAQPAFPCNISINEVAAHYTPGALDDVIIPKGAVVKVDVGAHVDGWIADTALTVDLGGGSEALLKAVREALDAAAGIVRSGVRVYDIGRVIQSTIRRHGFKPVRNLSGHSIGRYMVHAGLSIPNYPDRAMIVQRLRPGMIVAIEPFGTNGRGFVVEGSTVNIYSYTGRSPRVALSEEEARALELVRERFKTLPFTPRWLAGELGAERADSIARRLAAKGVLHAYPVLVEAGRGVVAQFEHTFVILEDEVIVTTREGLLS